MHGLNKQYKEKPIDIPRLTHSAVPTAYIDPFDICCEVTLRIHWDNTPGMHRELPLAPSADSRAFDVRVNITKKIATVAIMNTPACEPQLPLVAARKRCMSGSDTINYCNGNCSVTYFSLLCCFLLQRGLAASVSVMRAT